MYRGKNILVEELYRIFVDKELDSEHFEKIAIEEILEAMNHRVTMRAYDNNHNDYASINRRKVREETEWKEGDPIVI